MLTLDELDDRQHILFIIHCQGIKRIDTPIERDIIEVHQPGYSIDFFSCIDGKSAIGETTFRSHYLNLSALFQSEH